MSKCVLYSDRECNSCGECDLCDLDPNKICDNCMKCVIGDNHFVSVKIQTPNSESSKPTSKN